MHTLKRLFWVLSVLALAPVYASAQSFVYVANANSNNVSAYSVNPATGVLTAIPGSPFTSGSTPISVAVDPTGKFAYVANNGSGNISAYTINPASGVLTAIPGSPFAAGLFPLSVTVDPTGKFAYATISLPSSVSAYTIDPATGALIAVPGSPFAAGAFPFSVTVDPTGKFTYVANELSNNISAYTIDPATGALTAVPGSPFAAGALPISVTVDPTAKFVYLVNRGDGNVSAYTVSPASGALTTIPGSPFAAGANPLSIAVIAVPSDNTAPTTTATASPGSNSYGWNNTDVTVNLNATDNPGGSGVKQIQFTLGGAQNAGLQTEAGNAASVTISAEGTTILGYFATDNAGNQESAKTLTVRIDKTPPVVSGLPGPDCSIWPPNHKLVQVASVVVRDSLSGIVPGSFTVSGTSNDPTSGSIVITGGPNRFKVQLGADKGFIYTLTATAMDLAGNTTTSTATCTVPHDQRH